MALVLVAVSCTGASPSEPTSSGLVDIAVGLCSAAEATDVSSATNAFREVHGPLHDLADQTAQVDRSVAARLLRAKRQVEAAIDRTAEAQELQSLLKELASGAAAALVTLDLTPPAECAALEQPS